MHPSPTAPQVQIECIYTHTHHVLYGYAGGGEQRSWTVWKFANLAWTREREREREREIQLERGKEWGMQAPPHHIKYTNIYVCSTTWGEIDSEHLESLQI